jgi:hypothetical protein
MRQLPLIAGAALCLVVPLLAAELMVGSNDAVDRRSAIFP